MPAPAPRPTRRHRRVPGAVASIGVVLALAVGCSSTPVSGIADGPPTDLGEVVDVRGSEDVTVVMADNIYDPRAIQVSPGAVVTFRNDGANVHNATPNEDGTFAAVSLGPGATATVTMPSAPGTYRYYCTLHATRDTGLQRGAFVVAGP